MRLLVIQEDPQRPGLLYISAMAQYQMNMPLKCKSKFLPCIYQGLQFVDDPIFCYFLLNLQLICTFIG